MPASKRLEDFYRNLVNKLLKEAVSKSTSLRELCVRIDAIEATIKGLGGNISPETRNELLELLAEARSAAGCKKR